MRTICTLMILCLALGGCGGYYTLTAGDHVAAAGSEAPVVARLQRNDFFVVEMPVKEALIRFRLEDGLERGAYTDKLGYAGTVILAETGPGRYTLRVDHGDSEGEEIGSQVPLFVWQAGRPVIAVEADSLPSAYTDGADAAAKALRSFAEQANILYLTRRAIRDHVDIRNRLEGGQYPDGPILLWQRQRWHIVRAGRFNWPRIVFESRLVSQLPELRATFPKLSAGICTSQIAARAFADAGMKTVLIGPAEFEGGDAVRRDTWADLASEGI